MKLLRFIFPYLFVRNWHDGSWELSRMRLLFFCAVILLCILGLFVIHILQAPISYKPLPS